MEVAFETSKTKNLREEYNINWIWRAVECLADNPSIDLSEKALAERIGVSVEQVTEAIVALLTLGVFKMIDGKMVKPLRENYLEISKDEALRAFSMLSAQINSRLTTNDRFSDFFMLADEEIVRQYTPKFLALYSAMVEEGIKKGSTKIMASSISFTIMTGDSK